MTAPKSNSIFVVDDDPLHLFIYQRHITNLGYQNVSCFNSGQKCIDQLEQRPDIIFLDYHMAPLDGLSTLKIIKGRFPDICIVFVSGQIDTDVAVSALKCGAYDYIVKGKSELLQIKEVLEKIFSLKSNMASVGEQDHNPSQSFFVSNRWYNGYRQPGN
ncbi:response regulator [Foetidibacter luteolus]|uniref:response regulator n=1 Tax=Foetidibacter luteolus TaxID=2608880 RepID=UPI00129B1AEC|nr:response regulator [Foetidibacter luteolus]